MNNLDFQIPNQNESEHPSADVLHRFALGQMTEEDLLQCSAHLEFCQTCRQTAETVPGDGLVNLVRQVLPAIDPAARGVVPLRLHRGFELLEEVGRGGMAVVFKARQLDLGRIVAFKQIRQDAVTADSLVRFQAEAAVMAGIQHPNIVQVHDVGEQDGKPYLAMEFVAHGGLDRQLQGNPLPIRSACRLVSTLARAIQAAHEQSIVHRDLKPSNVLLSFDETIKPDRSDDAFWEKVIPRISDFGLAKHLGQSQGQTQTGDVLGTPGYMSPEQAGGQTEKIAEGTDIYSLGIILYEALTGRRPFLGANTVQTLHLICTADAVPPRQWQPRLSADLDVICLKCLEKEPKRRYRTAAELAEDLDRWLRGEPILARPVSAWERTAKWLKRNPAKGMLMASGVITLSGLAGGILLHNHRLQEALEQSRKNESVAVAGFQRGYDVVQGMIEEVSQASVNTPAWHSLSGQLYERAMEYHDHALEGADETNQEIRLSKIMAQIHRGSCLVMTGRNQEAIQHLNPAAEQLRTLLKKSPGDLKIRSSLATCCRNLAWASMKLPDLESADRFCQQTLELLTHLVRDKPEDPAFRRRLAGLCSDFAAVHAQRGDAKKSLQLYQKSVDLWRDLATRHPLGNMGLAEYGQTCLNFGRALFADSQREPADAMLRECESVLTSAGESHVLLRNQTLRAEALWFRAELAEAKQQPDTALALTETAIALLRHIVSQEPQDSTAQEALVRHAARKERLVAEADRSDPMTHELQSAIEFSDSETAFAILLPSIRQHRLGNRLNQAESELKLLESRLPLVSFRNGPLDEQAAALQSHRQRAELYFEWAELEIGRSSLPAAIERYDQSIGLLEALLTRVPEDRQVRTELSGRHRLKAWHLSRSGRMEEAFESWDLAIHYASGDLRCFTRTERALEMALLDDRTGALKEANDVAAAPDLQRRTAVHLARVYSCCIGGEQRKSEWVEAERDHRISDWATEAIRCLDRFRAEFASNGDARKELTLDSQLEPLRSTSEYRRWFEQFE